MQPRQSEGWTRRRFLGAGAAALAAGRCSALSPSRRPNVLVVMADDLGAECLGCYGGSSYRTPHLDALAASGLRFDNAFATSRCTTTRVQLLTGRYPFRTGWTEQISTQRDEFLDPRREQTFGHLLGAAGYAVAVAGKWQLGQLDLHPGHVRDCGFPEHRVWTWWYRQQVTSRYWDPSVWENGRLLPATAGRYGPDLYAAFLLDFMRRHRHRPWLAYYPMVLPHAPWEATPAAVAADRRRDEEGSYGESVAYLDEVVGRFAAALEDLGLRERTLVLFTADNGTPGSILSTFQGRAVRGGKWKLSEAGTRVPLIASRPGTTPAAAAVDDLVDLSDVLPTLLELAGVPAPADRVLDGVSFAGRLRGGEAGERRWVFVQAGSRYAVRDHRFRLHQDGRLFDLSGDRYRPRRVRGEEEPDTRRRLEAVVAGLGLPA